MCPLGLWDCLVLKAVPYLLYQQPYSWCFYFINIHSNVQAFVEVLRFPHVGLIWDRGGSCLH